MIRCCECKRPLVGEERPLRAGEPETVSPGPCRHCRGRRGATAARRIYQIHGKGYGRVAGRSKA